MNLDTTNKFLKTNKNIIAFILAIIMFVIVSSVNAKPYLSTFQYDELSDLENEQFNHLANTSKYKHKKKYKDSISDSFFIVNEYKMPKGERGFQIIVENDQYIISRGYGVLAEDYSFTYEKQQYINSTSTQEL